MRVLDLQRAFARPGAPTENFENKAGAVEHLGAPGLFEIALLHRRERAIHHHDAGVVGFDQPGDLLHFAVAEIGRRPHGARASRCRSAPTSRSMARASPTASSRRAAGVRVRRRRRAPPPAAATGSMTSARPVAKPSGLSRSDRVSRRRGSNQTFSPAGASSAPSNSWTG